MKLALAVRPRARPRRRTGRRNIPRAPSSFVKMAQRNTPGMLPTLGDTALSPDLTAATLTAMSSSSPRPTTYVETVLSNMGERAHATPLIIAPLPQSLAEPQPLAPNGHLGMVHRRARPRRRTGRRHCPRAPSPPRRGASLTPCTNIGGGVNIACREEPTNGPSMSLASSPPWLPSSTSSAQSVLQRGSSLPPSSNAGGGFNAAYHHLPGRRER